MKRNTITLILCLALISLVSYARADSVNLTDTTPPVLVSISIDPQTVDVSSGPATFIATVTATDDLNSMNMIDALFDITTFNSVWSTSNTLVSQGVVGGIVKAVWQVKLTIPQGIPARTYGLRIDIEDAAHNKLFINLQYPNDASRGYSTGGSGNSITVTNNKPNTNIDVSSFDISSQLQTLNEQVKTLTYANQSQNSQINLLTSQNNALTNQVSVLTNQVSTLNSQVTQLSSKPTPTPTASYLDLTKPYKTLLARYQKICGGKIKPKGC